MTKKPIKKLSRSKKVSENVCKICNGKGYLPITQDSPEYQELVQKYGENADAYITVTRCECVINQLFLNRVGPSIYHADVIETSDLTDYEDANLFLYTNRPDFYAHFRAYLKSKPLQFFWRMCSDADLLDIFLGKREDFESLTEYARGPELLVLQMGHQSYKNRALAGQVLEVVKAREFVDLPTWLINPHDLVFKEGMHLAWSPELEWHLDENYNFHTIKPTRVASKSRPQGFGFQEEVERQNLGKNGAKPSKQIRVNL